MIIYNGQKFGKWTVIDANPVIQNNRDKRYLCKCECGTERLVLGKYLKDGSSQSCGCLRKQEWIGRKFNKLTIINFDIENGRKVFQCRCECGNELSVNSSAIHKQKSCGCSRRINCIGDRYGSLVVDKMLYNYQDNGQTYVSCTCDCGKTNYIVKLNALRSGNTKSCGCLHMPDLVGIRFSKLIVIKQIDSCDHQRRWLCQCDCGCCIEASSYVLTSGHTRSCGCSRSEKVSRLEMAVRNILKELDECFYAEYTFEDCISDKNYKVRFDFYIPRLRIAIECDGEQHFVPVAWFGGESAFNQRRKNDELKNKYCFEHNIHLIRLPYTYTEYDIKDTLYAIIHKNPVTTTA